ncbi:MAG: exosortase/archaeosortase family protein [Bryobacteraceae bacterium]
MLGWFAVLLGVLYFDVLREMSAEWLTDDDMGHGLFVPFIAGYIVWRKRDVLRSLPIRGHWFGLVLLAWGGLQLVAGTLGAEMFVSRTALIVSLAGLILWLGGVAFLKELAFPLFVLMFMIRIPAIIFKQITFPLQLFASQVAETALNLIGIPVLREGNVLELPSQPLSVVEACSGIRSLLSLAFLAVVYAYFTDKKIWMRGALMVASVPVAVAANAFRVTATGVLSEVKKELAEGFFHTMEGFLVFLVAVLILVAVHGLINRVYSLFADRRKGAPVAV